MNRTTFQKLDLASLRIANMMIASKGKNDHVITAKKPYIHVKKFIMANHGNIDSDMKGLVNMKNVCKTTRQIHYLTNEVLHRLRQSKFFIRQPASSDTFQMLLPL